jgi:hypothetical protein
MLSPQDVIGKICKSLEKYYDPSIGRIQVKSRPVLVIGYEDDYSSIMDLDFELLPISKISNKTPHPTYDYPIDETLRKKLRLNNKCYIRTHKTSWNHVKHMDIINPIGDLKKEDPDLFNYIIKLNEQWVKNRTATSMFVKTLKASE